MRRLHALFALVTTLAAGCAGATAPQAAREPAPVVRVTPTPAPRPASPSRAAIRASLAARRARHLDVLRAYHLAGVFPHNTTQPGEGHFLIDDRGVLCAVANLIAQDGLRHLIEEASRADNGLLFAEATSGPFNDWILSSGFTRDEIARIQVPAPYVGELPVVAPEPMPEPPVPAPMPIRIDPFAAVDRQVAEYLAATEAALRAGSDASLDLAVAALEARPDLALALVHGDEPAPAPVASVVRFAQPPQ